MCSNPSNAQVTRRAIQAQVNLYFFNFPMKLLIDVEDIFLCKHRISIPLLYIVHILFNNLLYFTLSVIDIIYIYIFIYKFRPWFITYFYIHLCHNNFFSISFIAPSWIWMFVTCFVRVFLCVFLCVSNILILYINHLLYV